MRRIFAILTLLLLAGCVEAGPASGPNSDFFANSGPLSGKYSGADAGYLITTVAARFDTGYDSYNLNFRKKDRSTESNVWWGQSNMFDRRKLDIDDGKERGIVEVRRLPPGDYEFFNFKISRNGGTVQEWWTSKQDYSIPFTIKSGQATYVGEFMAIELHGKNFLGMTVQDGAYFVLSDKTERDVAIAKQKEPGVSEVTSAVVDPNTIGNPLISATIH